MRLLCRIFIASLLFAACSATPARESAEPHAHGNTTSADSSSISDGHPDTTKGETNTQRAHGTETQPVQTQSDSLKGSESDRSVHGDRQDESYAVMVLVDTETPKTRSDPSQGFRSAKQWLLRFRGGNGLMPKDTTKQGTLYEEAKLGEEAKLKEVLKQHSNVDGTKAPEMHRYSAHNAFCQAASAFQDSMDQLKDSVPPSATTTRAEQAWAAVRAAVKEIVKPRKLACKDGAGSESGPSSKGFNKTAPTGDCWQAHLPETRSRCSGYPAAGYTCVGEYCAAINPGGTPLSCATKMPASWVVHEATGRCVPPHKQALLSDSDHHGVGGTSVRSGKGNVVPPVAETLS